MVAVVVIVVDVITVVEQELSLFDNRWSCWGWEDKREEEEDEEVEDEDDVVDAADEDEEEREDDNDEDETFVHFIEHEQDFS